MVIDMHTHYFPEELLDYINANRDSVKAEIIMKENVPWLRFSSGSIRPISREFFDKKKRMEDMDAMGIDVSVISISPVGFFYGTDPETGLEISRLSNNWAFDYAKEYPGRIECMATVPMQDIPSAIREMKRCHNELEMNAVEIAPVINGKMLDSPEFFPFYDYCEKEGILIYLHPAFAGKDAPYDKYHGVNLIGYVQETNWALVRLLFGGVFEQYPGLKIMTSHGGGLFPYQFGRLEHGQEVRPENNVNAKKPIREYLKNIYYDSITHWSTALQFLVDNFGADHVVAGTDYPYDMADNHPVQSINAIDVTDEQRAMIFEKNCRRLLGKKEYEQ